MKRINRIEVEKILEDANCCPFTVLAEIAVNPLIDPAVRARSAAELAQFVAPKMKSIEVNIGSDDRAIVQPIDLSMFRLIEPERTRHRRTDTSCLPPPVIETTLAPCLDTECPGQGGGPP
jgi:hypothetical protein